MNGSLCVFVDKVIKKYTGNMMTNVLFGVPGSANTSRFGHNAL